MQGQTNMQRTNTNTTQGRRKVIKMYQVYEVTPAGARFKIGYDGACELASEQLPFAKAAGWHIEIFQGKRHVSTQG
jgi:hypothetical protein